MEFHEAKSEFFTNIDNDIELFKEIKSKLERLDVVENDPKRDEVCLQIENIIKKDKNRKIIVFSEYVDTVKHLETYFKVKFGNKLI